jgi:dTDP-4-amino-4,6-dideoxygalactose transaminase
VKVFILSINGDKVDYRIPFNKPYLHGRELVYIAESVASGKISGDGTFTKRCHGYFEKQYGFSKCLLTTSCTDALEMAALLLDIEPGDEVIVPAYTFVSSANAFALRGAKLVFIDSQRDHPNLCLESLQAAISKCTKAIVVVHYAGMACPMDEILELADRHGISVVEDAAQAVDSYYKGRPLGSLGTFGAFSFHETKNIISGEGGMLVVNRAEYMARAEIIREKGTNRSAFFRGEVDKYGWVEVGSSFLPSDIVAAYLYAQLECLDAIQSRRKAIWQRYDQRLRHIAEHSGLFKTPSVPCYAENNAHMYYLVCGSLQIRTRLIEWLKQRQIYAVFHYLSLHSSPYFAKHHDGRSLVNSDRFSDCLVRLPLFYELSDSQVDLVVDEIEAFCAAER